ncbi:MAG: sigma-70 family RNA polymerase sigma factor [Polyangiaceae bacterium]|nr:sigma-70 family RNA polymerase sigma factor [Polyangiaceae bacterium]
MTVHHALWLVIPPEVEQRVSKVAAADPKRVDVRALVLSVQRGNRADFVHLYNSFHRAVHAVLLARVGSEDARDLVQDVFVAVFEKIGDLDDAAAFPGWIMTMARNRATDHNRRKRPTQEVADVPLHPPPHLEAMEVLRALRALPEAYRETLIMRLVEDMTGPEIAERTGLTAESVRVNLHRGMKLLRAQLGHSKADETPEPS